jgi:hypothetical protein
VGAAQDELAAGLKHAPDFAEGRTTLRFRDVLEDFDASDVVEGTIGERQQRTVALPEIGCARLRRAVSIAASLTSTPANLSRG